MTALMLVCCPTAAPWVLQRRFRSRMGNRLRTREQGSGVNYEPLMNLRIIWSGPCYALSVGPLSSLACFLIK